MSNLDNFLKNHKLGSQLCDMHYGLSQLEELIPGFKLHSHHKIRCDNSTEAVEAIIKGSCNDVYPSYFNKMLVLVSEISIFGESNTAFYAVYSYDGRYFGSVCFHIEG